MSVRLLFDQNLSYKLVALLQDVYPGSAHIRPLGLDTADDRDVWRYAADNDYIIVSKDTDFYQRSLVFGSPPKVVWLRIGNCPTRQAAVLLRTHQADVQALVSDASATILILS
jgi:predicted nuclease of predicted toxin-antitoxin system